MTREGSVERDGDRRVLRFERRLEHPVERVWEAITEPDQMIGWWAAAELDLRVGGRAVLRWQKSDAEGNQAVMEAEVTELEPPRLFELSGDPHGVLRFELEPDGDACLLTFTAIVEAPDEVLPKALAGWHVHLDHLEGVLDGERVDWEQWDEQHFPAWERLHERYLASSAA
jgi:uncharacterized protein YndB with AHSA1/START domain